MHTLESFSLKGKIVILTGGAGLYGRGLTAQLAEAGASLVIASRDVKALAKVAAEETAKGHAVVAESLDQGDEASVLALRDRVLARFGRIEGLVNNAVARPMKSPDDPVSAWAESMRINATGLFTLTRAVGDVMAAQREGSIVNISSMMGMVGPNLANYEGTDIKTAPDYFFHKGGMINLTRYFAAIYGHAGVRTNCVSPGGFFNRQPAAFLERYHQATMLGRMAGERDLGGAVVFLLSPASAYITGANLPVDGGYTANKMPQDIPVRGDILRLATIGMIAGNGHPYSWSAIVNGFDPTAMAACPYPNIPRYLGAQPAGSVRVPGARVTHVWTDNPSEAPLVGAASLIPHVVSRPEEVIGHVDAVLLATDDGFEHVRRARPFIEAGLPVFVDKPLALTLADLQTFVDWEKGGARILSSSGMRYAPELDPWIADRSALGELRWISSVMAKAWENYGIHALEPVFRLLGPGFLSARLESQPGLEIAHLIHRSGVQVTLPMIYDGGATFGTMHLCGAAGQVTLRLIDTYPAFRRQMVAFIDFARGGAKPYPFSQTVELMAILIAGLRSRAEDGRRVETAEILGALHA